MVDVRFDRYYRYADLVRILRAHADEYPRLVRIESIGNSFEGREISLRNRAAKGTKPPA